MVPMRAGGSKSGIAVVCFDISDTIVEWSAAYEEALRESMGDWVGRLGDEEEAAALVDAAMVAYGRSRKRGMGRSAAVRAAVAVLQSADDERTVRHIAAEAKRLQLRKARLAAGAEETLRTLSARYRLAIVTNLERPAARELWLRLKLHRFIAEKDVFAAANGLRKPQRRLFRTVARRLGVPCRQCVMAGNSYRQDIAGALRAGWRAVWIRRRAAGAEPARPSAGKRLRIVRSISEMPKLFRNS